MDTPIKFTQGQPLIREAIDKRGISNIFSTVYVQKIGRKWITLGYTPGDDNAGKFDPATWRQAERSFHLDAGVHSSRYRLWLTMDDHTRYERRNEVILKIRNKMDRHLVDVSLENLEQVLILLGGE